MVRWPLSNYYFPEHQNWISLGESQKFRSFLSVGERVNFRHNVSKIRKDGGAKKQRSAVTISLAAE
jgi:hypothetical protein